jgi:hypothetical protein
MYDLFYYIKASKEFDEEKCNEIVHFILHIKEERKSDFTFKTSIRRKLDINIKRSLYNVCLDK